MTNQGVPIPRPEKMPEAAIQALQERLQEAEAALRAVREGQVEQALRESEARFRQLADASFEGLVIHADGIILDANARVTDVLGYNRADVIGTPIMDYIPPEYHEVVREYVQQGRSNPYEVELIHQNGDRIPIEVMGRPLMWQGREARVAALRDITERKRAQQALRASEDKYRMMVETAGEGIVIAGPAGPYQYVNRRMADMLGYSVDELLGKSSADFAFDEQGGKVIQARRELHRGNIAQGEFKFRRKDGEVLWALYNASPMFDEQGRHVANVALFTDITERKQMEQELADSEARANDLIRYAATAIYEIDFRSIRFIRVNDAMCEMSGYPREELLEMSPFALLEPESQLLFKERLNQTYSGAQLDPSVEYRVRTKDGRIRYAVLNTTVNYENRKPVSALVIAHDITERKQAETEREELLRREQAARATADAAGRLRDQFISVASHELKTPLTSIKGYAELLIRRGEEAALDPHFQRMADTSYRQTERLDKLIGAMLDVSRIERGQLTLEIGSFDVRDLIDCIVRDLESTVHRHRIEFISSGSPTIIRGDEARLEQVLQNLVQNAVKYSPLGGAVTVQLKTEAGRAYITVTDRGIGIPAEDRPQLFTQFFRARNAERYHINGLGVGLYVSREIVRLHGGDITVESQEGKGSTFVVTLPLSAIA